MDVKDFYYDLPQELIAQDPLEDRSSSRLMVLDKATGEVEHRHFKDIVDYLRPGDCLVINNTKVIPARLYGVKEGTEAKIEILLLKRKENDVWETLVKPGKKCKIGTRINFGEGLLTGEVIDIVEEGNRLIQFHYEGILRRFWIGLTDAAAAVHHTPNEGQNRYQTVYAKYDGLRSGADSGTAFYTGFRTGARHGRGDRGGDASCGTWHLPSGQGETCVKASHAFRVLPDRAVGGDKINRQKQEGHGSSPGTTSTHPEAAGRMNTACFMRRVGGRRFYLPGLISSR